MVRKARWPSPVMLGLFVAAALPVPSLATDSPLSGRAGASSCPPSPEPPSAGKVSGKQVAGPAFKAASVTGIRFGRHSDKTRIIIDLSDGIDVSYDIDKTGTMIMVTLPPVDWCPAISSRRGAGPVLGYYFDEGDGGGGLFGIATSVPVKIKAAFSLPPQGEHGYRIVFDLENAGAPQAPVQPLPRGQDTANLVSKEKAALVKQHSAASSVASSSGAMAAPARYPVPRGGSDVKGTPAKQDKLIGRREIDPRAIGSRMHLSSPPPAVDHGKEQSVEDAGPAVDPPPPRPPETSCLPLPRVPWWENNSQAEMIRYVNSRYGGDWTAYISKWETHLVKVVDAFAERKKVLINKGNITLEGEDFIDYVHKIEDRISITRCLARQRPAGNMSLSRVRRQVR